MKNKLNYTKLLRKIFRVSQSGKQEEDITQIIWVKKEEFGKYFENTFPTIIDVLKHA